MYNKANDFIKRRLCISMLSEYFHSMKSNKFGSCADQTGFFFRERERLNDILACREGRSQTFFVMFDTVYQCRHDYIKSLKNLGGQ